MAPQSVSQRTKIRRIALDLLPIVLAITAVALLSASKPWLTTAIGDAMFDWVAAAAVAFGLGCGAYFSIRISRHQDEVQKAINGLATRWGVLAGQAVFGLLLMLPPFREFMTASSMNTATPDLG